MVLTVKKNEWKDICDKHTLSVISQEKCVQTSEIMKFFYDYKGGCFTIIREDNSKWFFKSFEEVMLLSEKERNRIMWLNTRPGVPRSNKEKSLISFMLNMETSEPEDGDETKDEHSNKSPVYDKTPLDVNMLNDEPVYDETPQTTTVGAVTENAGDKAPVFDQTPIGTCVVSGPPMTQIYSCSFMSEFEKQKKKVKKGQNI